MSGHILAKCSCEKRGCAVCNGMAICTVCRGAEVTLTKDCCDRPITEEESNLITAGKLEFSRGKWWRPFVAKSEKFLLQAEESECETCLELLEELDSIERVIEQLLSAVGLEEGTHYDWSNLFGYEEAVAMAEEQVSEILRQRDEAEGRSIVNKTALEMQKEARDQLRARVAELEKDKERLDLADRADVQRFLFGTILGGGHPQSLRRALDHIKPAIDPIKGGSK